MKFEDAVDTMKIQMAVARSDLARFLDHTLNTYEETAMDLVAERDRLVRLVQERDLLGLEERSRAWYAVAELLRKLDPDLYNRAGSGLECATQSIQAAFEKAAKYDKIKEAVS